MPLNHEIVHIPTITGIKGPDEQGTLTSFPGFLSFNNCPDDAMKQNHGQPQRLLF